MKERINEKIYEIEKYLETLLDILPTTFKEYKSSYEKKWSCERGFENIIEGVTDLAFLVINEKQLERAQDDVNSFEILKKNNIISEDLSKKLKEARGMRNIIAHEYGKIDDEIVFEAISSELERDTREFVTKVKEEIK